MKDAFILMLSYSAPFALMMLDDREGKAARVIYRATRRLYSYLMPMSACWLPPPASKKFTALVYAR